MLKINIFVLSATLAMAPAVILADQAPATPSAPTAPSTPTPVNGPVGQNPTLAKLLTNQSVAQAAENPVTVSAVNGSDYAAQEAYFEHLESLDEQIQLATKEIAALQMQQQLNDLRNKLANRTHGFTLMQIQGMDGHLQAVFKLANGSSVMVAPGDFINENYKLKSIDNSRALVEDEKSGKTFPMTIGG